MVVEIYTDGSCKNKVGGWGIVVVNDGEVTAKSGGLVPEEPTTNNRAELFAIYVALHNYSSFSETNEIIIYSDSEYSIKSLTVWGKNWRNNGWKTSARKDVKNKDLIELMMGILDT